MLRPRPSKTSVFKSVSATPARFTGSLCPLNVTEEKERFLRHGLVPRFVLKGANQDGSLRAVHEDRGQIRHDLLPEARAIMDLVRSKYGDGASFIAAHFGDPLDKTLATERIADYLEEHGLEGQMTIYWTQDLTCSARMMWHGPNLRYNRPERRKYTLIIKSSSENNFLRECGIQCLMDHEIGTHYLRMVNDGLQPWFSDRRKFGLRVGGSRESVATEEGLATLNTVLGAQTKYLWAAAILYYTSCMASKMSFKELYDHLERYVASPDSRWRHVMRVKRGLADPDAHGGYGNDQCYFEGAVEILRNLESLDFHLLYSGRVCTDQVQRVRRLARLECLKLPHFLQDVEKYKRILRHIGVVNGIITKPDKIPPTPRTQRKRTSEGRRGLKSTQQHTPTPPPRKNNRYRGVVASTPSPTRPHNYCERSPPPSSPYPPSHHSWCGPLPPEDKDKPRGKVSPLSHSSFSELDDRRSGDDHREKSKNRPRSKRNRATRTRARGKKQPANKR